MATLTGIGGGQQIWNLGNNMINTADLVELELQTLEMRKTPYNNQKKSLTNEKQIYASMKTEFSSFVQAFKDLAAFKGDKKATTVSQDGFMSVQADASAIAGTYNITVEKLAERHQITTGQKINLDDKLPKSGTFTINGNTVEVTSDMTYKDFVNKINNGNYGVSVYSLDGQLFFTATSAGSAGIKLTDTDGVLESIGLLEKGEIAHEVTAPSDAEYTINGLHRTSSSNKIDAIPGVTINLEKVTTETIKLTVEDSDMQESIDLIKKMKDEYNKAVSTLDLFAGENGAMQGSNMAFSIGNAMKSVFTYSKDNKYLSSFGIEVDKTGIMTLDEEKLKTAFKEQPETAKQFFFGVNGLGYEMEKKLNGIFGDEGSIDRRSKSIDEQLRKIDEKIADIDEMNKYRQEAIIDKYSKLEQELAMLDLQLKSMKAMTGQKDDDD